MNTSRMLILGVAALAAIAAALLARGLLGGGTPQVKAALPPPPPATEEVLVAANDLQPGAALTASEVRWQQWPKSAVDASFITHNAVPDLDRVVAGAVVRAPLVSGEPLTASKIVHADSTSFMAAMVSPGMRAVSIGISTETGAGGFILPNDRVDVLVTELVSDSPRRFGAHTLLKGVRVLAVDQTYREDKDQKVVLAKTATLELTPHQAEQVERAQATGTISLSLRGLGDNGASAPAASNATADETDSDGPTMIIRYGIARPAGGEQRE
ncbi:MAG: Flp pilus assembly protein CpaB [Rhizomicrobium sp.]